MPTKVDKINFIDINTKFDYENAKLLFKKKMKLNKCQEMK